MWKLIVLSLVQGSLLAAGQVFLKLSLDRMLPFGWNSRFWGTLLTNWRFALCGLFFASGSLLWMYILKHWPLSAAYPLTSLTYVAGMVAAVVVFHEDVSPVRWLGVALIVVGCSLMAR